MELNERIQLGNIVEKLHAMKSMNMSDDEINNSFSKAEKDLLMKATNDEIEKGGKRAVIGETRIFGGKKCIKTADGWKYVGEGTGAKAQEHVAKHTTSNAKESNDGIDVEFENKMRDPKYRKKFEEEQAAKFRPEDLIAEEFHGEVIANHENGKYLVGGKWIDEDIVLKEKNPDYLKRRDSKKETEDGSNDLGITPDTYTKMVSEYKEMSDKGNSPKQIRDYFEDRFQNTSLKKIKTFVDQQSKPRDTVKPASTEPEKKEYNDDGDTLEEVIQSIRNIVTMPFTSENEAKARLRYAVISNLAQGSSVSSLSDENQKKYKELTSKFEITRQNILYNDKPKWAWVVQEKK